MRSTLIAAFGAALVLMPMQARAQLVASDASYTITRSSETFSSIAGIGTLLSNTADDAAFSVAISPFSFYGTTYSSVFAGINGVLSFGGSNTSFTNPDLSSPSAITGQPLIAAFWDDVILDATGNVGLWSRQVGDVTTIEWNNVRFFGAAQDAPRITFQAVINSGTGSVFLNYGSHTAAGDRGTGNSATVGIRGPSTFAQVGFGDAGTVADGDRLTIAPVTTVPEPASFALVGLGLAVIGAGARRRRMHA